MSTDNRVAPYDPLVARFQRTAKVAIAMSNVATVRETELFLGIPHRAIDVDVGVGTEGYIVLDQAVLDRDILM